jgi:hypothetical protein
MGEAEALAGTRLAAESAAISHLFICNLLSVVGSCSASDWCEDALGG